MNRILILFIVIFATTSAHAQMEFGTLKEIKGGILGNLEAMYMKDKWWTDQNGDDAAIIKIKIQDMSLENMKGLDFTGSSLIGIGKKQFLETEQEYWVAVAAGNGNQYLEAVSSIFGRSSRLSIEKALKKKTFYEVVLVNKRLTTISIATQPTGVKVYLDGEYKGDTPLEIQNQRFGKHHLKMLNQELSREEDIDVEEGNTMFSYDMQKYHPVDIITDPDGSAVYVDGEMIGKSPIKGYKLTVGAHTFKAEYSASQTDEKSENITEQTTTVILKPIKKSNVRIMTHYGGRVVSANLVVDNAESFDGQNEYTMTLPYGKHSFRVSYGGKTKEKNYNISRPAVTHTIKLSAKNDIVWPWQREYNHRPYGFSMGYVQKWVNATAESEKFKCDPAYWREGKSLSGIQLGIHFQPCLTWGLGLYTGLFYELFFASDNSWGEDMKNFTEHNLNLPLHLYYRIPFSENFSIAIHGGVSADYGIYASYTKEFLGISSSDSGTSYSYDKYYGSSSQQGPNQFQLNWDLAASFNIHKIAINTYISRGLLDNSHLHDGITGAEKIKINKFGVSLSILMGSDD